MQFPNSQHRTNGVESYIEWLDEVIQSNSFGNIAVTGDLGIGKRSLIRTFESQKKYKFINPNFCMQPAE